MSGPLILLLILLPTLILAMAGLASREMRQRGLDRWFATYLRERSRYRSPHTSEPIHVLLCIADHFEPKNGGADLATARARVRRWLDDYPELCEQFRDSDGRRPRHTFFYPVEIYDEAEVDALASLCRSGLGEVEIHLHHDRDTAENLRETLGSAKVVLAERHGLLARNRHTGELSYGFVHGNWALDNSSPDGRSCGVNNEIDVLRETGCYADFTMPSAPSPTQTRKINSIYYAIDDPLEAKSHDWGINVGSGPVPSNGLMIVQGPLIVSWRRRKWGLLPRIENGCIQGNQPPTEGRIDDWLRASVQIAGRPDWYFVKLHTHGAPEENQKALLGDPARAFHRALGRIARERPNFHFHYVTAREMYNLARAAEAGWSGAVADALDFQLVFNGAMAPASDLSRPGIGETTFGATCPSAR